MYFSHIGNNELKHFHNTLKANFNTTLSKILHKTEGIFDNKLFYVEEIITDSLYRVYPLFYTSNVVSSNKDDKVSNPRCLILLKQTEKETYLHFKSDDNINIVLDDSIVNAKSINDSLTVDEFNALVYILRQKEVLTGALNYKENTIIDGNYGTYIFNNIETQLRNNTGLIINNHLKNNPLTVKLTNPYFINAKYTLKFTVKSITGANICNDNNDDYKTTDTINITLIPNIEVPLDLTSFTNDSVLLYDVEVNVSFDVPEIVNGEFELGLTVDDNSIIIDDTITLTALLTGTGVVENYNIDFYEDNVLIDTITTDNTGVAELEYTPMDTGNHIYTAKFMSLTSNANVTVNKKTSSLTISLENDYDYYCTGETYNLEGTLLVNGETAPENTPILLNGNTVYTDNTGSISITGTVGNNLNIQAVYEGSSKNHGCSSNILNYAVYNPSISIEVTEYYPYISGQLRNIPPSESSNITMITLHLGETTTQIERRGNYYGTDIQYPIGEYSIYTSISLRNGTYTLESTHIPVNITKTPTTMVITPNKEVYQQGDTITCQVLANGETIDLTGAIIGMSYNGSVYEQFQLVDAYNATYTFHEAYPAAFYVLFEETEDYQSCYKVIVA